MAWHLAMEGGTEEIQLAARVWGAMIFLVLLTLWSGYAMLEVRLIRRPGQWRLMWQPALRLIITLALVSLVLPIISA